MILELLGSGYVALSLLSMDLAIDLHSQTVFRTVEVNDERTQRMLPSELDPAQPPVSEVIPQQRLGWRHPLA